MTLLTVVAAALVVSMGTGTVCDDYMKAPCANCPFRRDVTPYLHPERAVDIADAALNPFNDFDCHKTIEHDEETGEGYSVEGSKTCAGFLTIRAGYDDRGVPDGFEPAFELCYADSWEMEEAYANEWEKRNRD